MIETFNPLGDKYSLLALMDHSGDDRSVVRAARVSLDQDLVTQETLTLRDEGLIKYLIDHGHMTPFEHNMITFLVSCPLFVARQWMRHRIGWSYNEVSRRYTSTGMALYMPNLLRAQSKSNHQGSDGFVDSGIAAEALLMIRDSYRESMDTYDELIRMGIAREQARMVLPQSMYTRFYATTNLRALMHFVNLRGAEDAQKEIRAYAEAMASIANNLFPVSWHHFSKKRGIL